MLVTLAVLVSVFVFLTCNTTTVFILSFLMNMTLLCIQYDPFYSFRFRYKVKNLCIKPQVLQPTSINNLQSHSLLQLAATQ